MIVRQSASLSWFQAPSGAQDQIFITVRQFRVCRCGGSFSERGLVYRLQLPLTLASAVILASESRHILLSQSLDSPILEGRVPVFISPRERVAQEYPRHGVPL
jgi:hypothetical protein